MLLLNIDCWITNWRVNYPWSWVLEQQKQGIHIIKKRRRNVCLRKMILQLDDSPNCFGRRYSKTVPTDVVKNKEMDVSLDSSCRAGVIDVKFWCWGLPWTTHFHFLCCNLLSTKVPACIYLSNVYGEKWCSIPINYKFFEACIFSHNSLSLRCFLFNGII